MITQYGWSPFVICCLADLLLSWLFPKREPHTTTTAQRRSQKKRTQKSFFTFYVGEDEKKGVQINVCLINWGRSESYKNIHKDSFNVDNGCCCSKTWDKRQMENIFTPLTIVVFNNSFIIIHSNLRKMSSLCLSFSEVLITLYYSNSKKWKLRIWYCNYFIIRC